MEKNYYYFTFLLITPFAWSHCSRSLYQLAYWQKLGMKGQECTFYYQFKAANVVSNDSLKWMESRVRSKKKYIAFTLFIIGVYTYSNLL